MRRKRDPGTRNPFSWPLSKQRMMVCWETLQILAASPVVNTVFMRSCTPDGPKARLTSSPFDRLAGSAETDGRSSLIGHSSRHPTTRLDVTRNAKHRTRRACQRQLLRGAHRRGRWTSSDGVANLTTAPDCNQLVRCVNMNRGSLPDASFCPDPLSCTWPGYPNTFTGAIKFLRYFTKTTRLLQRHNFTETAFLTL